MLYGMGFYGRTAGIVGMGKLGRAVADRLLGFGMRVLYADPSAQLTEKAWDGGIASVTFPEMLEKSDFIFVLAPLTQETHHLFDAWTLAQIKPGTSIGPSRSRRLH